MGDARMVAPWPVCMQQQPRALPCGARLALRTVLSVDVGETVRHHVLGWPRDRWTLEAAPLCQLQHRCFVPGWSVCVMRGSSGQPTYDIRGRDAAVGQN